ncbi:MAG: hypothetical protein WCD25_05580, partial [Pseudolabrys sp.]
MTASWLRFANMQSQVVFFKLQAVGGNAFNLILDLNVVSLEIAWGNQSASDNIDLSKQNRLPLRGL